MKRYAFTLIELLIVISIIAVLIAILLPAMSKSRKLGKATTCLSNMRVMAQAVAMYGDANDGRFPTVGYAHGGTVDESRAWLNTMEREYGSRDVLVCPSDQSPHWQTPIPATIGSDEPQCRRMSYASNYFMTGKVSGAVDRIVMTRIERPSTTIFWAELTEEGDFAAADHVHPETWWSDPVRLASEELAMDRHITKANYALVDGHAEPFRFEATFSIDFAGSSFPDIAWTHNKWDPRLGW